VLVRESRGSGDSLSRPLSGVPRMEGGFYSEGRWKGRCPFPRAPIPETKTGTFLLWYDSSKGKH
jgi:hypothetical protein